MFADELVGREAFEGLQPAPEVVGADEVGEVISQRVVVIVVEAFHGGFLDRAVPLPGNGLLANRERDAPDLAIRPGVARQAIARNRREGVSDLGEPMFDLMRAADAVEDVFEGMNMPFVIGELDAIVRCPATVCLQTVRGGQHNVEPVGRSCDQVA